MWLTSIFGPHVLAQNVYRFSEKICVKLKLFQFETTTELRVWIMKNYDLIKYNAINLLWVDPKIIHSHNLSNFYKLLSTNEISEKCSVDLKHGLLERISRYNQGNKYNCEKFDYWMK